jgi:hypothetical protein
MAPTGRSLEAGEKTAKYIYYEITWLIVIGFSPNMRNFRSVIKYYSRGFFAIYRYEEQNIQNYNFSCFVWV